MRLGEAAKRAYELVGEGVAADVGAVVERFAAPGTKEAAVAAIREVAEAWTS
ncbi:hypothetical protein JOE64_000661 [Microbacterium dextranolyticum]|uniref:Uncharacterized protein n=1 Tax=Microbacterium dextranolyticum TaxID=36806 RepID=A0A9W6M539_9MICO|nr:hypothetical protein [Microbacterium dextranolyticum]GLJ94441.1 hypothetical protein GCM10017591_05020 [Microbacterium dextranolyticum]